MDKNTSSIAIVGAGITGLVCAYRLSQRGFEVDLFEASGRLGGQIFTRIQNGFIFEGGPSTFVASSKKIRGLINDLGLNSEVIEANPDAKVKCLYTKDGFIETSTQPIRFLTSPLLSTGEKLRALSALSRPISNLFKALNDSSSVISAIINKTRWHLEGASTKLTLFESPKVLTFKNGLSHLIDSLAIKGGQSIYLRSPIEHINFEFGKVKLGKSNKLYDKLILAIPHSSLLEIFKNSNLILESESFEIDYANVVSVCLGLNKKISVRGYEVLIDPSLGLKSRRVLIPSQIFSNNAKVVHETVTLVMGGTRYPDFAKNSEDEIFRIAKEELFQLFGISSSQICQSMINIYQNGITQPTDRTINAIKSLKSKLSIYSNLIYADPIEGGTGVAQRINQAERIVESICSMLQDNAKS